VAPPAIPGAALLAEYDAMLSDADYRKLLTQISGSPTFTLGTLCALVALSGGPGGGGTPASVITAAVTEAVDAAELTLELVALNSKLDALLALQGPSAPVENNDFFTELGGSSGLVLDVRAFGNQITTAAFEIEVGGLSPGDTIEVKLEGRIQENVAAPFFPYTTSSEPFIISENGLYSAAMSWAVRYYRLRVVSTAPSYQVSVFGRAVRGGAGV
jgi:hypothetical protein